MNRPEIDPIRLANKLVLKNPNLPIISDPENYPVITQIIDIIMNNEFEHRRLLLPNLHLYTDTISIFSDYGSEHSTSNFLTYSFLFCSYNALYYFFEEIKKMREKYGLNDPYKEISFKSLDYGPLNRSLKRYLNLSNNLVNGLLFTLIVDKNIISIIGKNEIESLDKDVKILNNYGFGEWKKEIAEKLLRVIHIICYFIELLSKENQKIFWMTDDDPIAPNEEKTDCMVKLFGNILSHYSGKSYENIGVATPFNDATEEDSYFNDLLSLPDLVAGSVEHYFSRGERMEELTIKEEADEILMWLANNGIGLKKLIIKISLRDGEIKYSLVEFGVKDPSEDREFLPIYL